jgi:hypothetical protein
MDMKKHILNFFSYPCWWIREKSEVIIKMEEVIKKGVRKGSIYLLKNEVIRLEN